MIAEDKLARKQNAADQEIREGLERVLRNANQPEITEEAVEEATEATSLALETEEVLEAAENAQTQGKPKRTYKKRIPKDVAYRETFNGVEVILTEKQLDFMFHLSDTCYWDHGVDSAIWVDCLCDEIRGQFKGKPMTVGAMISTICEKGLGVRSKDRMNGKKCTSFVLTELGKMVARDLGF
jgi:DNA-binding MarR family transcriptional regulator